MKEHPNPEENHGALHISDSKSENNINYREKRNTILLPTKYTDTVNTESNSEKEYEHKRAKKISENKGYDAELDWAETYGVNTEDFSVRYNNGKKETEINSNEQGRT